MGGSSNSSLDMTSLSFLIERIGDGDGQQGKCVISPAGVDSDLTPCGGTWFSKGFPTSEPRSLPLHSHWRPAEDYPDSLMDKIGSWPGELLLRGGQTL